MSTQSVKPSSLASLPPPSSSLGRGASAAAAAGAAAGAGSSPSAGDRRDYKSAGSTSSTSTADSLLESRIEAIIEKRLAAMAAVKSLPKQPAIPKVNTDARMGRGILTQLRDNARLSDDDGDCADRVSDIEDSDTDKDAPAEDAAAVAAVPAPCSVARTSAARRARTRIASQMLRNCATYGSVTAWVKQTEWKSGRNKHECEALAGAVDALLAEGTSAKSTGIEILMRRLSGVHLADQHSEWQLADSVAWNPRGNSMLPRDEVTRALKEADQLKRLTSNMSNGGFRYKRDGARPPRDDRRNGDMSAKPKHAWENIKKPAAESTPSPSAGTAARK
jgi:hypothetical protein